MDAYSDLAAWAIAKLRSDTVVVAAVVGGADNILESGEVDPQTLDDAQRARRTTGEDQVLSIFVMDTGESGNVGTRRGTFSVFVCDRGGYGRIRGARDAVLSALAGEPVNLTRGRHVVMVRVESRTGHLKFTEYNLDFERIDCAGQIESYNSAEVY